MAKRIKAIGTYRPRIALQKRAGMDQLVHFISRSTGLNESGVRHVLLELRDAVVFFNQQGQSVKLDGLGTYFPAVGLDGSFTVGHRPDGFLKTRLNVPHSFYGTILNGENIGKTSDELVAMWNEEHPDDPITP